MWHAKSEKLCLNMDSDDSNDEQYLMQLFWPGLSEVQFIDIEQEKQK